MRIRIYFGEPRHNNSRFPEICDEHKVRNCSICYAKYWEEKRPKGTKAKY